MPSFETVGKFEEQRADDFQRDCRQKERPTHQATPLVPDILSPVTVSVTRTGFATGSIDAGYLSRPVR